MIRYDPTASNHQDYELKTEEHKEEKPIKKKKRKIEEKVEQPIPVSKEIFYNVSEQLIQTVKNSMFTANYI